MNSFITLLAVAYALLIFLVLCLCLFSAWPRWLKVGLIAVVTSFYFIGFKAVSGVFGWPAPDALPERFTLLAVVIEEPSAERQDKGRIFLWVNALDRNRPVAEPRAYRVPYSKDLHGILGESMKKARNGVSQMGTTEPTVGPKGFSWLRPSGADNQKIKISDLPSPQLPEK